MKTVLLPVKDFYQAKQRLTSALQPQQRADLARAMVSDVMNAISRSRIPQRVVVYTASKEVASLARPFAFDVVQEVTVSGHSDAVNRTVDQLSAEATQILSIAGDLPTVTPEEIDNIFSAGGESGVTLVPSRDGTGTNAALFILPARIRMQYGENSLARHLATAKASGYLANVVRIPGMEFDIDTPEDLKAYIARGPNPSATWSILSMFQL